MEAIDIKTRKLLSTSGSFHVNSDVDRLYCNRDVGGRGLNSIVDIFIIMIITFVEHIKQSSVSNPFLQLVRKHEEEGMLRVSEELQLSLNIIVQDESPPKAISTLSKKCLKKLHKDNWMKNKQHGYLFNNRININDIDLELTYGWLKNSTFSSHVEGFICSIQEEEINTKYLKHKRIKNREDTTTTDCRLCHTKEETIHHIIASCPALSVSMYLPVRHDQVAKDIYRKLISNDENQKIPIVEVYTTDKVEIWWDTKIKTPSNMKHNKPDIVLWRKHTKNVIS